MEVRESNCINYPHLADEVYPNFLFQFYEAGFDVDLFTFNNCTKNSQVVGPDQVFMNFTPVDTSLPSYVMYDGFIVAVFNYSL